jgi:hypothetical protein
MNPKNYIRFIARAKRLGIVIHQKILRTTTHEIVPSQVLLMHEQASKLLADAINLSDQKSLDNLELQRVRIFVDALQEAEVTHAETSHICRKNICIV